jgi:hypothetical protein
MAASTPRKTTKKVRIDSHPRTPTITHKSRTSTPVTRPAAGKPLPGAEPKPKKRPKAKVVAQMLRTARRKARAR